MLDLHWLGPGNRLAVRQGQDSAGRDHLYRMRRERGKVSKRQEKHAAKWAQLKVKTEAAAKAAEEKQSPPGKPAPEDKK